MATGTDHGSVFFSTIGMMGVCLKLYTPPVMNMRWEMPQRPSTVGTWVVLVAMYAVVILCYPASFAIDEETFRRLGWEGGIETAGAVLFLVASVGFLTLFIRSSAFENSLFGRRTRRNLFLGLLAVIMFICFGEEIS